MAGMKTEVLLVKFTHEQSTVSHPGKPIPNHQYWWQRPPNV